MPLGFANTSFAAGLILLAASVPASAVAEVTVSGVLYHDVDEDGMQDIGEPGLSGHPVELLADGKVIAAVETGDGGQYSLTGPHADVLRADSDFHAFLCIDSFGSFNPLALDECMSPEVPWAFTTAQEHHLALEQGEQVVDFGVRAMDIMLLAGRALYFYGENDSFPAIVEAFHDGTKCGETNLLQSQGHNYELAVLGAGEVPGCPRPGDEITLTINGLAALPTSCGDESCEANELFYTATGDDVSAQSLAAIEDHAVYWAQELAYPNIGVPPVQSVRVSIDGDCQEAHIAAGIQAIIDFFGNTWVGFSNLAVPSGEIWPGCGYPGAQVQFIVTGFNGGPTGTIAMWEPGIHKVDLDLPQAVGSGDVNCDEEVDSLDALAFLQRLAALGSDTQCWLIADVNCDESRDVLDVLVILSYAATLPYELPPACPPINQSGP